MRNLISHGVIETYAPLNDIAGSYTAQFEHVISSALCYKTIEANIKFPTDHPLAQHAQGGY